MPKECYLETEKVEYIEITNESEEVAYEAILINQIRPKYNTQFKDEGDFNVKVPEFQWNVFEWEYEGQLAYPDNIQLLYRDWMYNMESEQKNIEEIFIVKNMLGDIYCAKMVVVDDVCANLQDDIKSAMPC